MSGVKVMSINSTMGEVSKNFRTTNHTHFFPSNYSMQHMRIVRKVVVKSRMGCFSKI